MYTDSFLFVVFNFVFLAPAAGGAAKAAAAPAKKEESEEEQDMGFSLFD